MTDAWVPLSPVESQESQPLACGPGVFCQLLDNPSLNGTSAVMTMALKIHCLKGEFSLVPTNGKRPGNPFYLDNGHVSI